MRLGPDREGRLCLVGQGACSLDLCEDLLGFAVVIGPRYRTSRGYGRSVLKVITDRFPEWVTGRSCRRRSLPVGMMGRSIASGADPQNGPATWSPAVFQPLRTARDLAYERAAYRTLITTIYGRTSEIMKTIIARETRGQLHN